MYIFLLNLLIVQNSGQHDKFISIKIYLYTDIILNDEHIIHDN